MLRFIIVGRSAQMGEIRIAGKCGSDTLDIFRDDPTMWFAPFVGAPVNPLVSLQELGEVVPISSLTPNILQGQHPPTLHFRSFVCSRKVNQESECMVILAGLQVKFFSDMFSYSRGDPVGFTNRPKVQHPKFPQRFRRTKRTLGLTARHRSDGFARRYPSMEPRMWEDPREPRNDVPARSRASRPSPSAPRRAMPVARALPAQIHRPRSRARQP
jgi:hypothetical protein